MGLNGLEPSTSRLSGGRSNLLSYKPVFTPDLAFFKLLSVPRGFALRGPCPVSLGGDNRDRTDDPLLAKQVLSQLSYTPVAITFLKVHYGPQKLNNDFNLGPTVFRLPDLGMLEVNISLLQVSIERR